MKCELPETPNVKARSAKFRQLVYYGTPWYNRVGMSFAAPPFLDATQFLSGVVLASLISLAVTRGYEYYRAHLRRESIRKLYGAATWYAFHAAARLGATGMLQRGFDILKNASGAAGARDGGGAAESPADAGEEMVIATLTAISDPRFRQYVLELACDFAESVIK